MDDAYGIAERPHPLGTRDYAAVFKGTVEQAPHKGADLLAANEVSAVVGNEIGILGPDLFQTRDVGGGPSGNHRLQREQQVVEAADFGARMCHRTAASPISMSDLAGTPLRPPAQAATDAGQRATGSLPDSTTG